MKLENNLGTDPIKKLVIRLAIPAMLAQFVNVLYSIVDRMYIGNIPEIGETALAGVGICGPIVTMISAFASWIGVGGAPLLSIRLGEKNTREARQVLANCFVLLLGMAAAITVLALFLKEHLLWWFGATKANFSYAETYMTVYVLGTVFNILALGLNQFIICQGFAKIGMASVVLGAVCNIVLDPVFIFGFNMGVAGAALATVISQMASCAFALIFLFSKRVPVPINFGGYSLSICRRVLTVGFTPFLIIVFDNVLIIAQNVVLQRFGGNEADILLTCNTIVQSLMLMITMPLGGITGGTQTILGFNYGAGDSHRVLQAEKQIVKVCLIFTTVMFVLAQAGCGLFVQIFTREPLYLSMSQQFIRIYTLGVIPLAIQYAFVDGYTGMGIAKMALLLSFIRKGIYLALVALLPVFFGASMIFWAEPVSDVSAAIITGITFAMTIRKILERRKAELRFR